MQAALLASVGCSVFKGLGRMGFWRSELVWMKDRLNAGLDEGQTQRWGYCLSTHHNDKGDGPNEAPDEVIVHSEPTPVKEAEPGRDRWGWGERSEASREVGAVRPFLPLAPRAQGL